MVGNLDRGGLAEIFLVKMFPKWACLRNPIHHISKMFLVRDVPKVNAHLKSRGSNIRDIPKVSLSLKSYVSYIGDVLGRGYSQSEYISEVLCITYWECSQLKIFPKWVYLWSIVYHILEIFLVSDVPKVSASEVLCISYGDIPNWGCS